MKRMKWMSGSGAAWRWSCRRVGGWWDHDTQLMRTKGLQKFIRFWSELKNLRGDRLIRMMRFHFRFEPDLLYARYNRCHFWLTEKWKMWWRWLCGWVFLWSRRQHDSSKILRQWNQRWIKKFAKEFLNQLPWKAVLIELVPFNPKDLSASLHPKHSPLLQHPSFFMTSMFCLAPHYFIQLACFLLSSNPIIKYRATKSTRIPAPEHRGVGNQNVHWTCSGNSQPRLRYFSGDACALTFPSDSVLLRVRRPDGPPSNNARSKSKTLLLSNATK